ncbi:hypothetical protein HFP51_12240 [Parasphingopyxis sp. CP4]|uniref:hypothetical protein n=1 Tax=Parasphingopyxis sp. CP4 TaxID=2724527 RepID=UPI0015A2EDD6|nr:hypothetical protein [Parasphingopyxis sp. CP4]QLC22885.1 hypothetical protein HFP51_12240 [Parasphingopyxis sp. CP4]
MSRFGFNGLTGAVATLIALGACSAAPTPAPAQADAQAESDVDWRDVPLASGTWIYREDDRGSLALYGEPDSDAVFLVRCNMADRRIYFSLAGAMTSGSGTMAFQATHGERSYAARNGSGASPYIVAATDATDDYLDMIAFSRGRIAITVSGQSLVAVPNWPEMTRIFEDCRA